MVASHKAARRLFVFLFTLSILTPLSAQDGAGESSRAVMLVSPNPVGVNDNISLILEVPAASVAEVDVSSIAFPSGVQVRRGPYLRPFYEEDGEGNRRPHVRISYTLRSRQTGRISVAPLKFTVGERPWTTGEFLLEVGTYQNRRLTFPLEVEWQTPSLFVHQGEAVPLTLMVLRQREIGLFDSLSVIPPRTGFFEEAPGIDAITSEKIGGVALYNVPAASYLYTPSSSGVVTLEGGHLSLGELSGKADRLRLEVLALPEEVVSTGAVGRFRFGGSSDVASPRQGEELRYTLTVTGEGNLNYLQIPDLTVTGGRILSEEKGGEYSPSSGGYVGSRYRTFIIQVEDSESMQVQVPAFPYVEKPSGALRIQPEFTKTFRVVSSLQGEEEGAAAEEIPDIISSGESPFFKLDYRRHPSLWLLLLPGPLVWLVIRSRRRGKKRRFLAVMIAFFISSSLGGAQSFSEALIGAQSLIEAGQWEEAGELLKDPPAPEWLGAWHHARGILAGQEGRWDEAVWHLRTALQAEPMRGDLRNSLLRIEAEAGIRDAYPPQLPLERRLFFLLLVVSVNAAALMGVVLLHKPRSGWVILLLLFLVAAGGSAGLLGAAELGMSRVFGVVMSDGEGAALYLKRIPRGEAADWFLLKPGTTLLMREQVGDYYLVENGASVTGWIHRDLIKQVVVEDE